MSAPTKQELRQLLKERRASFPPEIRKEWDRAITERIAGSSLFASASVLLLYVPRNGEVNLLPLARIARRMGKPVAFPKCDPSTGRMEFRILTPDARLSPGAYGIPEPPANAPLCQPDRRALCLVPGLGFDLCGNRIGYGKGYYDRYLRQFPGTTVGVLYSRQLLWTAPAEPHDMPMQWLASEEEFCLFSEATRKRKAGKEETAEKRNTGSSTGTAPSETPDASRKKHFFDAAAGAGKRSALHAPAALVLSAYLLLLLSRIVEARFLTRSSEYAGVILLQILIFILPAFLYCKLRGESFPDRIRLRPVRPEHLLFSVCMLVVMICGGLLTEILTGGISSLAGNFTLYSTFVAHTGSGLEVFYAVLAYAVLPAFGEELVFRSILCAEYEKRGAGVSVAVSALFFAMLHFSFAHFLTYLLLGILLAVSLYVTRSFLMPCLLHLLYNVFCLFGQPYLSAFYVTAGSNEIFIFCLVLLFLLFSAFGVGEMRKIYHHYAVRNLDSSYTVSVPWKLLPAETGKALFSPVVAADVIVWLIASVLAAL